MIPLFKVFMPDTILGPLGETLFSGFVGQGPKVEEFEAALRTKLGYNHLATVNSGTSALHLALKLANIQPNDEIISTPLTCFATNAPIVHTGARIKWADVEPNTCNISLDDVERKISSETKAIVVVHWGGYPVQIDRLKSLVAPYGIPIIEDCAHAFGAKHRGMPIGSSGNLCAFSFQAIKHLTTIDGGLLTVPPEMLKRAKLLRWYGIDREEKRVGDFRIEIDVPEAGFKFHMNDVNATIGLEQLKHIDWILDRHISNAKFYSDRLQGLPGILSVPLPGPDCEPAYWLYTIQVERRDNFMRKMDAKGIQTSRVHARNDTHSCLEAFRVDLPNLDLVSQTMISIPVGWWVSEEEREYIAATIEEGW